MDKKILGNLIKKDEIQSLINSVDFYYQKGQDALNKWLKIELSDKLKDKLIKLSKEYGEIQKESDVNPELKEILDLFFEIISYCDAKAKDKSIYNKYKDIRSIATASVRMDDWVNHLILYKFTPGWNKIGSTTNAFKYLLDPENNATILSENHRNLVSENLFKKKFISNNFINDLKTFFSVYNLKTNNPQNYTALLSWILYSFQDEWKEKIIGLMASDGTGWQDEHIEELRKNDACIVRNTKIPSGKNETIKFLRNRIEKKKYFNLYYCSKGIVNFKANVIDFAVNQKELDEKDWDMKFKKIYGYFKNFDDYENNGKKKKIIFLVNGFEKIRPIPVSDFQFYNGYKAPTQDNLSPIKYEPGLFTELNTLKKLISEEMSQNNNPLNQILFGPPGTGKTYNTVNKALEIIAEDISGKDRKEIKKIFDSKVKEGQIVFTTFHQSMNYDDFIEGIKPNEPKQEGQNISYRIVDGIFKKACATAAYYSYLLFIKSERQSNKYSFDDLYQAFIESIQEQIDKQTPPVYKTLRGREVEVKEINRNDSIIARAKNSIAKSSAPLTKENLQKLYDKFNSIEEIKDLKQVQETVEITPRITEFYAVFSGLKDFEKTYEPDEQIINERSELYSIEPEEIQKKFNEGVFDEAIRSYGKESKPVVLIIDEINRGNVSQIFGELITLIEKDKRLGSDEALTSILTYSKKPFGVPKNLYIIGTMNTADRSVEALDTALRRRFSFEEIFSNYDLDELQYNIFDNKAFEILRMLNSRIEILLDKDHLIGHSYFIFKDDNGNDIKDENILAEKVRYSFYDNIIPLLQEYFFGDYGKIGLVLGSGFVKRKEGDKSENNFADFKYESSDEFNNREIFEIIKYSSKEMQNFENALKLLMNKVEQK